MNGRQLHFSVAAIATIVFGYVADSGGNTAAADETETPRVQKWGSHMTVTSDCGFENKPNSTNGFATPVGSPVGEMPDWLAERVAKGAGREQVETDWDRVAPGYVLIEPDSLKESYLVGTDKEIAASFTGDYYTKYTQILPDGGRLYSSNSRRVGLIRGGGGATGCVEEYDSEGNLNWRLSLNDENFISHHAVLKLPNGNVLAQVWQKFTADDAISQGRDPDHVPESGEFWFDGIVEVDPYEMEIVWEWSLRNHLIQDFDVTKSNYGVVADHPELMDINVLTRGEEASHDWAHGNSIDYDGERQQILLSIREMNEIIVIDHSTIPREAAGHTGGRYGMGGDILYRWGNPQNYDHGTAEDRMLFLQHDAQRIRPGNPGAGNILIFSNGEEDVRPYTTVVELTPPLNADGTYSREEGEAFGPKELAWEYNPGPEDRFYSAFISGAQRLPNGNTFINAGAIGHQREVTPSGDIVWEYAYKSETGAPTTMFRAVKFPPDYPGIADLIARE